MTETDTGAMDGMDAIREQILEAALPHVAFDGWTQATLDTATRDAGFEPADARLAFPGGARDMAVAFHRMLDKRLAAALRETDLGAMRIRERVTFALQTRIALMADHREAVRRAATLMALPMNGTQGAKLVWETADTIWTALGDPSEDYNWYTKRAILASVWGATVLFWLGDDSADFVRTKDFIDRRIDGVMQFEKVKASVNKNPLFRAAFWGPSMLLSMIKAPAGRRTG